MRITGIVFDFFGNAFETATSRYLLGFLIVLCLVLLDPFENLLGRYPSTFALGHVECIDIAG
jgi:hypothetical protein